MTEEKVRTEYYTTTLGNGFILSEREQPKASSSPQRKLKLGSRVLNLDLMHMDTHMPFSSIFREDSIVHFSRERGEFTIQLVKLRLQALSFPRSLCVLGLWRALGGRGSQVASIKPLQVHTFDSLPTENSEEWNLNIQRLQTCLLINFLIPNKYSLLCLILYS